MKAWLRNWWPMLIMLVALALVVVTVAGCSSYGNARIIPSGPASATPAAVKDPGLTVSDVEIRFKVKSRQCFGSAGCDLLVRPEVHLFRDPGKDQVYEITFRLNGDESGPIVQTVTLTGSQADYTDIALSTAGPSVKIYGKVTGVERWPY